MRRRGRYARYGLVAGAVAIAVSSAPACRTATQVTIELRTVGGLSCSALKGVSIVVARTPADAEARMGSGALSAEIIRGECGPDGHTLGSLVITPSESTAAVVVRARMSEGPNDKCAPPDYLGCIVARRSFAFIEHAALTMPIGLEESCLNKPCNVVTSCRTGTCVSSATDCSESSGTCVSLAEPVILPDGGAEPVDGAVVDGGPVVDAPADGPSADAPAEAQRADADAGPGRAGATNHCVVGGSLVDCNTNMPEAVCCRPPPGESCASSLAACVMPYPGLKCLGAAHCASTEACCYETDGSGRPTSSCKATCPGPFLCSVNADCLDGKLCNQPGPTFGGGGRTLPVCEN